MTRITMESGTEINVSSDYEVTLTEHEKFVRLFVRDPRNLSLEDKRYKSRLIRADRIYSIEYNIPD